MLIRIRTYLSLRKEEESPQQRHNGDTPENPTHTKVDILHHIRDNKVGYERPDNVPCSSKRLCLLAHGCVGDFGADEVGD
jgi:hypothetical protein